MTSLDPAPAAARTGCAPLDWGIRRPVAAAEDLPESNERVPPAAAPHRVRLPVNIHRWEAISFLHWPLPPQAIAPLLPAGLTVDTYEGSAWVTLTPFFIRVRPPGSPIVPPGWAFPETNLRTYVRGPDGRQGLWFLRMEVTAAWFVAVLRGLGLPYFRQRMSVDRSGDLHTYLSVPRRPSGHGGHHVAVRPGIELQPPFGGPFERFLTARWGAYHRRGLLLYTPVEHPPWPLQAADVEVCDVGAMFEVAGLPTPPGAPLAHYSRGVAVRVGRPRLA